MRESLLRRYARALWPFLFLWIGFALRLSWGRDIEFKGDEAWTFARVTHLGTAGGWSWVGMPSSVGTVNPGMSLWIFLLLGKVFGTRTPVELARAVQLLNCLALVLFLGVCLWVVPKSRRPVWLGAFSLAAVNPICVLLQRKIWPQSVLPFFVVACLWAWLRRDTRTGAFFWGLLGALLGQFHMAGFFFAFALWAWTLFFGRAAPGPRPRWRYWLGGSVTGALSLLPWLSYVLARPGASAGIMNPGRWLELRFWIHWVETAFGVNLSYSLGHDFRDFLQYPLIGGHATFLAGVAEGLLWLALAGFVCLRAATWLRRRKEWRSLLAGSGSEAGLLVGAGLFGMGAILTLPGIDLYVHYLMAVLPVPFLWLSSGLLELGARGRRILVGVVACQLVLSACFLGYIHVNGGSPHGDYGTAYSRQGSRIRN